MIWALLLGGVGGVFFFLVASGAAVRIFRRSCDFCARLRIDNFGHAFSCLILFDL